MTTTATGGAGPRAPFGRRLAQAMETAGPLCLGVDPHPGLLRQLSLIHNSEPTRLGMISYAVFCLTKKKK